MLLLNQQHTNSILTTTALPQLTDLGKPAYVPQTDAAEMIEGYKELVTLLAVINLSPNNTFERDLNAIFDVDLFLRFLVFEVATGNWDGIANGNNFLYVLHQRPISAK
jgi:spore coat protein CotH